MERSCLQQLVEGLMCVDPIKMQVLRSRGLVLVGCELHTWTTVGVLDKWISE